MIGTTSSEISDQLRMIYPICYTGDVRMLLHGNGKIEIISFVVKVCFYQNPLSTLMCMSRYEADLAVSVQSFISSAMRKMRSAKSHDLQLFSERTSSILAERELRVSG